jgi:hypothetical protein
MPRLFLCWIAALSMASWVGIASAEIGRFSALAALGAGALAAGAVALAVRRGAASDRRSLIAPLMALALVPTISPVIDTTLFSQDASVHRASGAWLARTGAFDIPDPALERLSEDQRFALFDVGSVTAWRLTLARLPGGVVLPDIDRAVSFPSFAHLLAVWVAIAEQTAGDGGVALLGPLFAFTAWWAIGLIAFADAGWIAAVAALALIASWLPEHWFARFLMPEILAQALVWSGVAAARLASSPAFGGGRVAGALTGITLGVAAFARLEQLGVFVPSLLLARALLPADRRVFPRGALLPFVVVVAHAAVHLFLVPTDYGNRVVKIISVAWWNVVVAINSLAGGDGYVTIFIVRYVLVPGSLLGGAAWLVWTLRRDRRVPGFAVRANAAVLAMLWLVLLYSFGLPASFPAVRALFWYVPWTVWGAIAAGASTVARLPGLDLALVIEAADQLFHARVTAEQVWASRRLVTVVLPLIALAAARAAAGPSGVAAGGRTLAARALVAVSVLLGVVSLAPTAGRTFQQGGADLAERIAARLPADALVVLARPLDWTHLAASLWLRHGRTTIVVRDRPGFEAALGGLLEGDERPRFLLAGAASDTPDDPPLEVLRPPAPRGFELREVERFEWPTTMLETTQDRAPRERITRRTVAILYELQERGGVEGPARTNVR